MIEQRWNTLGTGADYHKGGKQDKDRKLPRNTRKVTTKSNRNY